MVLVDTSVLIEYLKGRENAKTEIFAKILTMDISFGISVYTYQEILQGAKDEREYKQLQKYLDTQIIYYLPTSKEIYAKAARQFFIMRRRGVTVRGTIDMLIAMTAIENNLLLLHNDRDFDAIAASMNDLQIF